MLHETRQQRGARIRQERMREARAKGRHTKQGWDEMVAASASTCARCGAVGPVCKDHILPIYQGGSDSLRNIQPLCWPCNESKGPENTDHRIGKHWMRPEWSQGVA